ncbi:MAG: FadR/GntR family transcriptional regulator [Anaerolineales bacterium]|jgi:DNA-binding FadR family transcriptional regulator
MLRERTNIDTLSEFVRYLARHEEANGGQLPPLSKLSRELGVSIASLREQLEVARALGLVEVKPRTGIKRLPYTFAPAVRQSLRYALIRNNEIFGKYSELRNHIESAYWHEAVQLLTEDDKRELQVLLARAKEKLNGNPIQIPHEEHRILHLAIYQRLENPFVTGLLEAYWDAYEAVGLNVFTGGLSYLEEVWEYHTQMIEAICNEDYEAGYQALIQHTDLLYHRPTSK